MKFDNEMEIEAPIEYVFTWGTNPDNWQRATPALIDLELIEETDEGTHYRNTMKLLGRTTTSDELFIIDEENFETVSVFDDENLRGEMRYTYTETETGTTIRMHGEFEAGSSLFERAIQPVVTRYFNRQFRNSLKTMQELIEAEYALEADEAEAPAQ